jgi:hypothetical protein
LAPDAVVAPVCRLTLRPGDDLRMYIERRDQVGGSLETAAWASAHPPPCLRE